MTQQHLKAMSDEQLVYLLDFVARPIAAELRERGCDVRIADRPAAEALVFRVTREERDIVGSR